MNKISLFFITLFCIICSFLIGYTFGKEVSSQEMTTLQNALQVSLHQHGNTLDIQKSHKNIRIIVDGKILSETGSVDLKRE